MNRAVFFDRDGTLIEEKVYLSDPNQVVIFPGASEALKRLQNAGFKLLIVTNQSGIGRGYYTVKAMHDVNARLIAELERADVRIEKIYFAPEAPEQPSRGRKPSPQFLFDARDEFGIDLSESYMVGDKLSDLECGWNAGVKGSILVRTGYGSEHERIYEQKLGRTDVVSDLVGAADHILNYYERSINGSAGGR
jgi:D-glycero-D-manno-heptose 1,7-bisphosphate phosphatase